MIDILLLITLFAPLVGFIINGIFGKFVFRFSGYIGTFVLFISAVSSSILLFITLSSSNFIYDKSYFYWIVIDKLKIPFGLLLDNLSAIMIFVVSFVSFGFISIQ
jgi:NADH-Ubiquinone oxidoreductase (complex I), chain 5 N-terminus.